MAGERSTPKGKLRRVWRHRLASERQVLGTFDDAAFARIEDEIADGERRHRGEIRFAVEADLDLYSLWAGLTPRERALQVFSEQGVWDTEENTGVLIYLLWADHAVEIIADRAANRCLPAERWQAICSDVGTACREGRHVEGVLAAVKAINAALEAVVPAGRHDRNELPNRSILL